MRHILGSFRGKIKIHHNIGLASINHSVIKGKEKKNADTNCLRDGSSNKAKKCRYDCSIRHIYLLGRKYESQNGFVI